MGTSSKLKLVRTAGPGIQIEIEIWKEQRTI